MSDAQQSLAITETVKPLVGEVVEIDNTNRGAKWKRCTVRHVCADSFVFAYPNGGEGAAAFDTVGKRWRFVDGRTDAADGHSLATGQGHPPTPNQKAEDMICCSQQMTFDPKLRGQTVGGLLLVGWFVCGACGEARLAKGWSKPADAVDWTLSKGGRSINAGGMRIRVDGQGDVQALMQRIMRLPALEEEVERLQALMKEQP